MFFSDAVRMNPLTAKSNDFSIEEIIKKWLQFACDRDGGRSRREKARLEKLAAATAANKN